MDPFAKYLPATKAKLDLSNIQTEDDVKKFCIEYLEKKGYYVHTERRAEPEPKDFINQTPMPYHNRYGLNMPVLTVTHSLDRDMIQGAHNTKGLEIGVQRELHDMLRNEIIKSDITTMTINDDYSANRRIYRLQLGVFKP